MFERDQTMSKQQSDAWFAERCGKVTASRIADVVATTKSGGWGATRANYMAELVSERLTGVPYPSFTSAAMQWGTDMEAEAIEAYQFYCGQIVEPVGFVVHPHIEMSGASPDGLVAADGLVEVKCPNTATHITSLLGGPIESKYILQMQWQMACTGRAWCDFCSFDPRMPEEMRLLVTRVNRDDKRIELLAGREVVQFLDELDERVKFLIERYGREKAA